MALVQTCNHWLSEIPSPQTHRWGCGDGRWVERGKTALGGGVSHIGGDLLEASEGNGLHEWLARSTILAVITAPCLFARV